MASPWKRIGIAVSVALLALLPAVAQSQTPPPGPASSLPTARAQRHPKLDSLLNDLADQAETQDPTTVARNAPTSRGTSVAVRIRPTGNAQGLAAVLTALGALPANVGSDVIEAYVPVTLLKRVADLPSVASVRTIIPPQPDLVTSQGAALHHTPNWNDFGFTGTLIKVGIIDVGFGLGSNKYSARQAAGEVPAPTAVRCWTGVGTFTATLSDCEVGTQHGAAVAETIIDEAPNASLYLSNPGTQADLLATVQWMASQGVQVINHSVSWTWDGPGDGTSIYSDSPLKAVDAAAAAGIVWVNSAGNANQYTWTGAYSDANSNNYADFSPSVDDNNVALSAGVTVVIQLRWTDTWGTAATDLDLLLYNPAGTTVVKSSTLPQSGGPNQDPYEWFQYTPPSSGTYHIRVGRFSGTPPAQVQIQVFNGVSNLSIQTSGHSIANPAESANAGMLAIGAAWWNTPTVIESFSSQGPTNDNRIKPDIVGADCGDTVTYGAGGFCGTSQASPHVAGLAALLLQKSPGLTPTQVVTQLKAWAIDRGPAGVDNAWGSGFAQLQTIAGKLTFTQQPSSGTAGIALATQPKVEIQSSGGVTNGADNATTVTLSVTGAGSPTISCTGGQTKTVAAGVATFAGCSVTPAGSGYTLLATPSCFCLTSTSNSFTIAPGANKLAFTTQPSNGITNTNLATQPVVTVQDSGGTTIGGDNATVVTLSLAAGQAQGTATQPSGGGDGFQLSTTPGLLAQLEAGPTDAFTKVGPPQLPSFATGPSVATATFIVNYTGFSAPAQAAFQAAVDIWSQLIVSSVPIVIDATWAPAAPNNLGSAGPYNSYRDFSGAPQAGRWYPLALANALHGSDLDPAHADIVASFNSTRSDWYLGTDGNTPAAQYDFMSVVLHEIGHGLGFLGSMSYSAGSGSWGGGTGFPYVYDQDTVNGSDQALISAFTNPSAALGSQLVSSNIFFNGANAMAANGGAKPKLYAPNPWTSGSSISHLDEATYPAGDPNSLMTPQLAGAESIHNPGLITLGVLKDIGWPLASGGTGTLACTGGLSKTVASGVATFSGCQVSGTGSYVIHATSSPVLTPADSAAFTITGPPDHLVFSTQPVGAAAGAALPTQPVVTVKDAANATVLADQASIVTLTLNNGGGAVLTCAPKTAVNGVATFTTCSVNNPGIGYGLHAASGALTTTDSALFTLFGAATKLAFTQQPASGIIAQPFPLQPIVAIQDALGTTVTTNTTTVTLSIFSGTGTLACGASLAKAAVAGVATFSGCNINAAGSFVIRATDGALTAVNTAPFTVFSSLGTEWYFAEGFTGSGWNTSLHLLNANAGLSASVHVVYLLDSGSPVSKDFVVLPQRAFVIDANSLSTGPGPDAAFGVHITSDIPIVAEEQMYAGSSGDFAHGTQGATGLSTTWYFAEGFTQFGWQTFVLIANPGAAAANVTVTYQVQGGSAVTNSQTIPAGQRYTFAGHLDVPNQAFSVSVSSSQPVVAEMAMYDPGTGIAHRAVGVTAPGTNWYLGEGFTGSGWQTFISVGNPGNTDATVTAVYSIDGGSPLTKQITVPAHSRGTFIAHDPGLATGPGPGFAFGVHVSSTQPVVVQEVLIDPTVGSARANSTMAAPALNARWSFSGGSSAAGLVSFYTVSNPNGSAVSVGATYYFDDATAPVVQTISIPANSRGTFATLGGSPAVPAKSAVGVIITSTGGAVVAQEAVYDEAAGRAYSSAGAPG
jgi:hypothetical protein